MNEVVQIGNELLVIEETGKEGEGVYSEETQRAIAEHRAEFEAGEHVPDEGARQWAQMTIPAKLLEHEPPAGYVTPGTFRMCKNELCNCSPTVGCGSNMVTASKNLGRIKLFCCAPCGHKHHARSYQKRHRSSRDFAIELTEQGEQYKLIRLAPRTIAIADASYENHIERGDEEAHMCPNATEESLWACPSHMLGDAYSTKKMCIVYAVLVDDMKALWAKGRQEVYTRQFTTTDGRWLGEDVFSIHETEGNIRPSRLGA